MSTLDLFDHVAVTAERMAKDTFTEPDDDWTPIVFLEDATGTWAMMPIEEFMQNDRTKDMLVELIIPETIKRFEAKVVVMILSVWHSKIPKGVDWQDRPMPSEDPNRSEALVLTEYTAEGVKRYSMAEIIRHEDSPPTLGEWENTDATDYEGRFVQPIVKAMQRVIGS
jgi:hypothetical protein